MGLAEDLKALQDLREKGEMTEADYTHARDAVIRKQQAAPSGAFRVGRLTGFLLVPVLVALVVWYLATVFNRQNSYAPRQTGSAPPVLPLLPQPHYVPVTNGALTVNANSLAWYTFVVPPNASTVAINGHFTATGGMGNDIIAYITDEDGLANLKNGHEAHVYYNSQKVTQSAIAVGLPNAPGNYYLVFDNRFSLITPKAVQVNATLSYMR
jgi:hypothetical protein